MKSRHVAVFAATFALVTGGVNAQTLKLVVNGKDVSAQATRTAAFISYLPSEEFGGGPVTVVVSGADTAGNPLYYKWTFTVVK